MDRDKRGMLITTKLTGTTTTAAQQTTAANSTSTAANVTVAAESGFEVLRGTTTDPLGTAPPSAPTTGDQVSYLSIGSALRNVANAIGNKPKSPVEQAQEDARQALIRNLK
jgi:hypothetical protein